MCALTAGLALRPLAHSAVLFVAASVLALAEIGTANVIMPVVVKHYFPNRVGFMTGVYAMGISLRTTIGAAARWLDARSDRVVHPCTPVPTGGPSPWHLTHSRTAWAMAIFFGLQVSVIFCAMGFLAQIFRDAGVSSDVAGVLLAVAMAIGVPVSLVLPTIAGKMRSQGVLVVGLAVFGLAGFAGRWRTPAALPWVSAFLIGVSCTSFPLALVMIALRARTEGGVARLSAFAQCVGYLLAVPGPILVGVLHQYTDG